MENKTNIAFLSFILNNELYAINIKQVLEVFDLQKLTDIPLAPDYILGVTNFRGDILPVVSTHEILNLNFDIKQCVIIVLSLNYNNKEVVIGVTADRVSNVVKTTSDEIQDVPDIGLSFSADFLSGIIKHGDSWVTILNADKTFSIEDLAGAITAEISIENLV